MKLSHVEGFNIVKDFIRRKHEAKPIARSIKLLSFTFNLPNIADEKSYM